MRHGHIVWRISLTIDVGHSTPFQGSLVWEVEELIFSLVGLVGVITLSFHISSIYNRRWFGQHKRLSWWVHARNTSKSIYLNVLRDNNKLKRVISSSRMVDLVFLYYLSHFHFHFNLFFIFLFLELRVSISNNITWSHISHIRWHSDSDGYKSHDTWKDIEGFGRRMLYNM